MATRIPALIQLSDPRVAAQLVTIVCAYYQDVSSTVYVYIGKTHRFGHGCPPLHLQDLVVVIGVIRGRTHVLHQRLSLHASPERLWRRRRTVFLDESVERRGKCHDAVEKQ